MAICVQGLDYAVICFPATSRRSDGAKIRQESIYEAFILESYGFWQVIIFVAKLQRAFVVNMVKIVLRQQRSSSDKSAGVRRPAFASLAL